MNENYDLSNTAFGSLTRYQTAAYMETSIVNTTQENVVMIDNRNNQKIIPPMENKATRENCISIFKRDTVGPSLGTNGEVCSLKGQLIKIDKHKLRNGPIYVKEVDALFCTEEHAVGAKHPYSPVSYNEGLDSAIDKLSKTVEDAPSIKLMANDPTGSIDRLYTILDQSVVTIPVSHEYGDKTVLSLITVKDGKYYTEEFDLGILLGGTTNIVRLTNRVIPWITTSEINATELAKTFSWITPETFAEKANAIAAEKKREIDQLTALNTAKTNDMTIKISALESEIRRLESEKDDYKFKYTSLKTDRQNQVDLQNQNYELLKARNDFEMSQGNLQLNGYKVQMAQQESQFKLIHLVMAAALPVLGVMAMKLFTKD